MPAAGELPGRIVIRGLRCRGRQGTTPIEQQQAHDYLVDVSLSVDVAEAVERDDLAAALNISEVAVCVTCAATRQPSTAPPMWCKRHAMVGTPGSAGDAAGAGNP